MLLFLLLCSACFAFQQSSSWVLSTIMSYTLLSLLRLCVNLIWVPFSYPIKKEKGFSEQLLLGAGASVSSLLSWPLLDWQDIFSFPFFPLPLYYFVQDPCQANNSRVPQSPLFTFFKILHINLDCPLMLIISYDYLKTNICVSESSSVTSLKLLVCKLSGPLLCKALSFIRYCFAFFQTLIFLFLAYKFNEMGSHAFSSYRAILPLLHIYFMTYPFTCDIEIQGFGWFLFFSFPAAQSCFISKFQNICSVLSWLFFIQEHCAVIPPPSPPVFFKRGFFYLWFFL